MFMFSWWYGSHLVLIFYLFVTNWKGKVQISREFYKNRQQEAWISQEVLELSEERSSKSKRQNKMTLHLSQSTTFWTERLHGRPGAIKTNGFKTFALKLKMHTKQPNQKNCMQSVKSKTGTILTEQSDVKERGWKNYRELYNEHNPINEAAANSLPFNSLNDPEPHILKDEIKVLQRNSVRRRHRDLTQSAQKKSKQQGEQE